MYSNYYLNKGNDVYFSNFEMFSNLPLYQKYLQIPQYIYEYRKLFGAENVKVVLFDDIMQDFAKQYQEILSFLEVDSSFAPDFRITNSSRYFKKQNLLYKLFDNRLLFSCRKLFFRGGVGG